MSQRKSKPRHRISRVTTRQGDAGETQLADGSKRPKSDAIFAAIGDVDELNSQFGTLLTEVADGGLAAQLREIQQQLFDLGAYLATVGEVPAPGVERLEAAVTALNAALPPLNEFVVPGGNRPGAAAHVCRSVCRRAERSLWRAEMSCGGRYLNRLGDYCFVLARALNAEDDRPEDLWRGV